MKKIIVSLLVLSGLVFGANSSNEVYSKDTISKEKALEKGKEYAKNILINKPKILTSNLKNKKKITVKIVEDSCITELFNDGKMRYQLKGDIAYQKCMKILNIAIKEAPKTLIQKI